MRPPWVVEAVLRRVAYFVPTWAVVPTKDLADAANENPEKREYFKHHPMIYHGRPRLGTAVALLTVTEELGQALGQGSVPFLLLHGDADSVTDPAISQALYDRASSADKAFKLYPGMWHSLVQGAFPQHAAIVLKDIVSWLDERRAG